MSPEPGPSPRSSRGRLVAVGFGSLVAAAAMGWLLASPSMDPAASTRPDARVARARPADEPPAAATRDGRAGVPAERAPPRLPDGALPPIIGEPRHDRIPLCDDRNWGLLDGLVREVRDGELLVEEAAWEAAGASTRAGVASWASKCRLADAPIVVRGGDSGNELGYYDATSGYARTR